MRWLWLVCFISVLSGAEAQDPAIRTYTMRDGLAQMKANTLELDSYGFLWIGTRNGLSRFDGQNFTTYTTPDGLLNDRILALDKAPDGRLVIMSAGGVQFFDGADFQSYPQDFPRVKYHMRCMPDTSTWILDNRSGDVWTLHHGAYTPSWNLGGSRELGFNEASRELYVVGADSLIVLWPSEKRRVEELSIRPFFRSYGDIRGHAVSSDRSNPVIFFTIGNTRFTPIAEFDYTHVTDYAPNGLWVYYQTTLHLPARQRDRLTLPDLFVNVEDVLTDSLSQFWVASDNGLGRIYSEAFEHIPHHILPNVWSVIEDDTGNLWFGTYGNGLYTLASGDTAPKQVDPDHPTRWREYFPGAVKTDDGVLHFANAGGITSVYPNENVPVQSPGSTAFTLWYDTLAGVLVEGSLGGIKVTPYPDGEPEFIGPEDGVHPNDYIQFIDRDHAGCYWLCSYSGVTRICRDPDTATTFTQKNGTLPCQGVFAVCEDPDGRLWLGGDDGLLYYDFNAAGIQRLPSVVLKEMVKSLMVLDTAHLLIAAKTGLFLLNFRTFAQSGIVDIRHYNASNGYQGIEPGFAGLYQSADGRIWITSASGLDVLHPELLDSSTQQLRAHITTLGGVSLPFDHQSFTHTLDPGQDAVTIDVAAIGFTRPFETQFQYQLDAGPWSPWSSESSLVLTHLRHGPHRLSVRAGPTDLPLDRAHVDTAAFNVSLIWYQRAFFLPLAMSVIIVLLAYTLYAVISQRRARKRFARQQAEARYLRSQLILAELNPHFIFNVLASIQNKVLSGRKEEASAYLVKLSRLMRNFLNATYRSNTGQGQEYEIPLSTEIDLLTAYIEFEQDKGDNHFRYRLEAESALDPEQVSISPMLVQPYVENAIKHGLLPAPPSGMLEVLFSRSGQSLVCIVRDNGIGRVAAEQRASRRFQTHRSLGTKMIEERIELLNQLGHQISVVTRDVLPTGTEVEIRIAEG